MATKNKTTSPTAKQGKHNAVKTSAQKPTSANTVNKTGKAKAANPSAKDAKSADKGSKRCAVCDKDAAARNRVHAFNLLVEGVKHVGNALGQLGLAAIDLHKSFALYCEDADVATNGGCKEIVHNVCQLAAKVASTYEPLVHVVHNVEVGIGVKQTEFGVGVDTFKVVNIPLPAKSDEKGKKKGQTK